MSIIAYCNYSLKFPGCGDFCNIETSHVDCSAELLTGFCIGGFYVARYFPAALNLVSTLLVQIVNDCQFCV